MIEGKEKFIKHISNCLGRDTVPVAPTPLIIPHTVHHDYLKDAGIDELKEIFTKNAEASGTTVYQCDLRDLNETIIKAVTAFGNGQVVMADHDFFSEHDTFEVLKNHCDQLKIWDQTLSREENIAYAEQASVGIAKAELALAESGTVILFSHLGSGRSVSLLPTYTVTIIRKQDLRPRLTQAMSFLREQIDTGLPTSVNFISGASSTADIELVRVQGVHGPLATSYVIVD
ncbi:MAG: lactate utilization protein C [Desulfobulbaceae bacterium]|nr:lactate utilization protein C [Desulfobulbaceae bacterium]